MELAKGCLSVILGLILLLGFGYLMYGLILVPYLGLPALSFGKYVLARIAFATQMGVLLKINTIKTFKSNKKEDSVDKIYLFFLLRE